MGLILFALMMVVPILEIGVFIVVGRSIGLWPTLAGILLTALVGSAIIRHQGLAIITKARQNINAGQAPVAEVLEGVALLIAGALLLTPGFVTDTLGFLLLVPSLRRGIAAIMLVQATRRAEVRVRAAGGGGPGRPGGSGSGDRSGGGRSGGGRSGAGVTIEGEWEDLSEPKPDGAADSHEASDPPRPGQGWGGGSGAPDGPSGDDDRDTPPPARSAQG